MRFTIQIVIENENDSETIEEIVQLDKGFDDDSIVGMTLLESKELMKTLQTNIILQQAKKYAKFKRRCSHCNKNLKLKGYHSIQYRTLFGIVTLPSPRLFHCQCKGSKTKTFSPLSEWLTDKNSPELQYIETKWASLMSYKNTATLLQDVLPVGRTENPATVRGVVS